MQNAELIAYAEKRLTHMLTGMIASKDGERARLISLIVELKGDAPANTAIEDKSVA